jgi:integrase
VQHDRKSSGFHAIFLGVCFLVRAAPLVQRSGPFNKDLKEKTMNLYPLDASLTLAEAGPKWLQQHGRMLKENTTRNYRYALGLLNKSFGDLRLREIDVAQFRSYQQTRGEAAGPYLINGELSVLQMIMKECGEWDRIRPFYKPLRVPKRRGGHSISADEERQLREVAFSRPKWRLAAHCMMVMLSTTMGFGELRHIRRRDVDLKKRSLLVRDGAKNLYRDRTIPMNTAAYESMCWILDRWKHLGGREEEEFILPHRPRTPQGSWIFTEPMTAITTAFNGIRKEAGLPQFRVYDCRVQAITKLLSNPAVSPQVSKEIAGHISEAMQSHYSIQQHDTKMAALEALEHPAVRTEPDPSPPAQPPASADIMHPAIQAEIARQISIALASRDHEERFVEIPRKQSGPRLVVFPGSGAVQA